MLEEVKICPICNGATFSHFLSPEDHTVSHETFDLKRCDTCSLVLTSPRPDQSEIGKYYESSSYISHNNSLSSFQDIVYKLVRSITIRSKVSIIENIQDKGTILDIGCGTGILLQAMHKRGWKTVGVEPSKRAASQIQKSIQVVPNLSDVKTLANVITLWHVLEHVHEINHTLDQIDNLLLPNGTLLIAVPNFESHDATRYQAQWAAYDVPRHLWHFSQATLKRILANHGFTKVEVRPMRWDAYYVSLLSERYLNQKKSPITRAIRAIGTAIASNKRGGYTNTSSLLYIVQR